MAAALSVMTLSACAGSGHNLTAVAPQSVPADIRACFDELVPAPPPGPMTKAQVMRLIADLKRSELEKSQCGRRLLAFHDATVRR